jgi:hypothetical protein
MYQYNRIEWFENLGDALHGVNIILVLFNMTWVVWRIDLDH